MAKRVAKRKRTTGAGGMNVVLPALSTLSDLPAFEDVKASDAQRAAFDSAVSELEAAGTAIASELALGCVVRLDRGFPAVLCADETFRAEFATRLTKGGNSKVSVGDWVVARRPQGHDMGLIERILPRENAVERWRGGSRGEMQTLAANVDLVIAVYPLAEEPLDCARLVRPVVVARDSRVDCAVALTKADRQSPEVLAESMARFKSFFGDGVPVVTVCAEDGRGVEEVRALVPEGTIAIVLGVTGAGKSTLLNALLGHEALETGAVRESDDLGRHTTVTRRMVKLPDAGVIVDEPGFRNLLVVGHEHGLAKVFPTIVAAAHECKFRDCTHTHEPGCGVLALAERGEIDEFRLKVYRQLATEMRESAATLDPDVVL